MPRLAALILLLLTTVAQAQSLRFFCTPYEVFSGDAVVFNYLEADRSVDQTTVKLNQIVGWQWDFYGDGTVVEEHDLDTGETDPHTGLPITIAAINTTWYAAIQPTVSSSSQNVTPKLYVRKVGDPPFSATYHGSYQALGMTENVYGLYQTTALTSITVKNRALANADLTINFSVTPRFALAPTSSPVFAGDTIKLYSQVTAGDGRTLSNLNYNWTLTNAATGATQSFVGSTNAFPQINSSANLLNLAQGAYNITLTIGYSAAYNDSAGVAHTSTVTSASISKKFAFQVVPSLQPLQLGRAYRAGFPATYGWDDIVKSYSALGPATAAAPSGDDHVYFHHFEDAYFLLQGQMFPTGTVTQRQLMAETVNEMLQGQTMGANQQLITALRIKYPRLSADVNPNDASSRMNAPAGARTETAAIDQAVLDYSLAVQYAAAAIRDYGTDILRSKAPVGAEPFPQFPLYLTIIEPTLSKDAPIPVKNEYWQLSTAFERMELGRVEKAKKLWRMTSQDTTALADAKTECKTAGTQSYLAMALLASGQSESDYQSNEGNLLLAHVKNARDLFNNINAGVNPLGNDGSYIPNESFASIYQAATEAVTEARSDQINARQETRTYQQYQADLRNELQSQRASFITPLVNLTGLDPALYNNLATVDDRNDYKATIITNVNALLGNYPNVSGTGLGDFGNQVIAILDAGVAILEADNRLKNQAAAIEIAAWANTQIKLINQQANVTLKAHDIARGYANSVSTSESTGTSFGASIGTSAGVSTDLGNVGPYVEKKINVSVGVSAGVSFGTSNGNSVNTSLGSITSGYLNADDRDIQVLQQAQIADINLDAEARKSMLDLANLVLDIRRAKNAYDQQNLKLDQMLSLMNRYIEDLAHARDTAAPLYFQDPTFTVVVSTAMDRADKQLDYTVDKLYRLEKTLAYEWTEDYKNPVTIPANSSEPASLENALFDKFTNADSLFFVRTADEAYDYISALKAWDSKLRRINGVSVRGPNHSQPLSAVPISMREQILGMKPDASRGYTLDMSIRDFRNFLQTKRVANYYNVANPSLQMEFLTQIDDNTFFPATGSRWNMRIAGIAADTYAESGFSNQQVIEYDLIQSGTVSLRRFFASPPTADDVQRMRFYVDNPARSAFAVTVPSSINGALGGRPSTEFTSTGLADRPVAATNWILQVNTENPANSKVDFSKIKDILIRFTYTYGNPPQLFSN